MTDLNIDKAERLTNDEEDDLTNQLCTEMRLAQVDYIRKKRLKGEEVDKWKMDRAINQRKHIKGMGHKLLGSILGKGTDFMQEARLNADLNNK